VPLFPGQDLLDCPQASLYIEDAIGGVVIADHFCYGTS
jgi:hypothetical protein